MTQDNEGSEARAVPDGRIHHCCSEEGRMGATPLESDNGPLQDRAQVNQEGSNASLTDDCFNQNGSIGVSNAMAAMAGQSSETKDQEKVMDILNEARQVCEERGKDYGHPYTDFTRVARLWDVLFEDNATMTGHACIKPEQVAIAMILLKIARICQNPDYDHRDSRVDLIGYTLCLDEVIEERKEKDYGWPK